ncbi:MAG: hypothetical protein KKB70_08610 [Proteobacteria bacterium]|nr:hypothetical protein [Pseudomonadota bacterium]MBU1611188.1 hypothetical protein [Pseudomonadota bacterium]
MKKIAMEQMGAFAIYQHLEQNRETTVRNAERGLEELKRSAARMGVLDSQRGDDLRREGLDLAMELRETIFRLESDGPSRMDGYHAKKVADRLSKYVDDAETYNLQMDYRYCEAPLAIAESVAAQHLKDFTIGNGFKFVTNVGWVAYFTPPESFSDNEEGKKLEARVKEAAACAGKHWQDSEFRFMKNGTIRIMLAEEFWGSRIAKAKIVENCAGLVNQGFSLVNKPAKGGK